MGFLAESDLADYLNLSDAVDLAQTFAAAEAASAAVEAHCGREFVVPTAATARVFRAAHPHRLFVDDIASTTDLVVRTDEDDDGTFEVAWAASDYELHPLNARHVFGIGPYTEILAVASRTWPRHQAATSPIASYRSTVQITARWGWAAIPPAVHRAALQVGAELFKRKDAPFGVAGFGEFGPIRLGADVMRSVTALLEPYRGYRTMGIA